MRSKTRTTASSAGGMRFAMAAALAILLTVRRGGAPPEPRHVRLTAPTTGPWEEGCPPYAAARLGRPAAETVAEVPPDWADWIADLDDRMTGTCR